MPKTLELKLQKSEEKIRESLHDNGFDNDFINVTPKA
jgi:hypothetical protein